MGGTAQLRVLIVLAIAVWAVLTPRPVAAHSGPPYAVMTDQQIGPYTVTVWADPDVGTGTFLVDAKVGAAALPDQTSVVVLVQPEDGRLQEIGRPAQPQQTTDGIYYVSRVPFDARGQWRTRVVLNGPAGSGETSFNINVTPSYPSWLETIPCFLPFIFGGMLWWKGVRHQQQQAAASTTSSAHSMDGTVHQDTPSAAARDDGASDNL